jgi:acyl-CoA synthetase (AMP-forming)/AMP-acid ligase II/acyl carrier protein
MAHILGFVIRCLLWLRYDIEIRGLQKVRAKKGVLILPNHPGEMDPAIICAHFWPYFQPRPVVIEDFYYMPGVHWLLKQVGAIPMPNMESRVGTYKKMRINAALTGVADSIRQGRAVLLYPAGRLMRSGLEDLRATTAAADIIQQVPEVTVLRVRTRGLIGSAFSWVAHQDRPPLGQMLTHSFKLLLQNGIFFCPRRKVTIEIEEAGDDYPGASDKMAFNRWLENWYNEGGGEEMLRTPQLFWDRSSRFELAEGALEAGDLPELDVAPEVRAQVVEELGRLAGREPEKIRDAHNLDRDLGLDSLASGELVTWLDETFHVVDVENSDLRTVRDLLAAATHQLGQKEVGLAECITDGWVETNRPNVQAPDPGLTIPENFLKTSDRMGDHVAFADNNRGVLSYSKARVAVVLLAEIMRQHPEPRVGIMLPATAGTNLVTMAVMLAGKVPVMINWTVGDANLRHVIQISGVKTIYTSGQFLDRLEGLDLEYLQPYLKVMEDLARGGISLRDKLRAAWRAKSSTESLLNYFETSRNAGSDAVVLFTSGSESVPKGVPLSHRNIQSNHVGCLDAVKLMSSDVIYGFLPPFHSFGFTITSMLPMVSGIKAVYYPNPTDSRKIAQMAAVWAPTVMCGTPTFISSILRAAEDGQLVSLRLMLAGAEKAPDALFAKIASDTNAQILEGYGITECAPVLTMLRLGKKRVGVGLPVGDVEIKIVDIDTHEPLPLGERGLILAAGNNVFAGYLGRDSTDAFVELKGKRFYNTGDLGILDEAGNLSLAGRLKRFVKIGGEMISLPAMESAISAAFPDDGEEGPAQAITYVEPPGQRAVLALYSVQSLSKDAVNAALKAAGFSNLARISQVESIDEMPLLGTGKTDYRSLTAKLKATLGTE